MDDYYSIRLNRWLTSLKIPADTSPACVNVQVFDFILFIFYFNYLQNCRIQVWYCE